jgi:hypothetical protein
LPLEPADQVGDLLRVGDVDVLMPAGDEHDDERPEQPLAPALGIRDIAEPTEIDLGQFARLALAMGR